jgi:hypothetical protein
MVLARTIDRAWDRFQKIRLGQIISDIDGNGEVDVRWLDGEPGGQSKVLISFPAFNNVDNPPWGIEFGFSKGVVGLFGFLVDNHAVLLSTIVSKIKNKGVGYDKTQKIQSGEIRISSKNSAQIYWDLAGNLILTTKNLKIFLNEDEQKIEMTSPGGVYVNGRPI